MWNMKEIDMKKVRQEMYREIRENEEKKSSNDSSATIVREAPNQILIESQGHRTFVPSMPAFTKLLSEHDSLKITHNKALKEINVLKEAVNKLIQAVNEMDDELKKKIDMPDA